MQSNELALRKPENNSSYENKNAILNVLNSFYGSFKIIYTIVNYKPNLERHPEAYQYWAVIQSELGESVHRCQVQIKELDLVVQTFNTLAHQLRGIESDIGKYNLSSVMNNSYPSIRSLNHEIIPKCFENIAKIQGIALDKCKENFEKLLPAMGAETFISQQEELQKLKDALNSQIQAKNSVLSSEQFLSLKNEVELRKTNVVKYEVSTSALNHQIPDLKKRIEKLEKELEELVNNAEAYLKKMEAGLENIDSVEGNELELLNVAEQNEHRESKSQWDQRINEAQEMIKTVEEKILDPDNGFIGGVKKCLNLAKPFLALWNPVFLGASFDTGSKEPTTEELMKLCDDLKNQQAKFVELAKNDAENIQNKYEKYTERVKNKYNQYRATADKIKENREAARKARNEDLTNELDELRKELETKLERLTSDSQELAANLEQRKTASEILQDYIQTNMNDKQNYINQLRERISKMEEDILKDLRQVGQSSPQAAYYFLNAVQDMSKIIQSNITKMGGASNFTANAMVIIRVGFDNIDRIISLPDDNSIIFWKDFLKYLNENYENELKCTHIALKNFTLRQTEENFAKLGFRHPDYSEDLKSCINDYFADFKSQNNPLDKNEQKKKEIELNCRNLYEVFNFSAFSKELDEAK